MTQDNSDQKEFWAGPSGQSWITEEARQDSLLSSVARQVVQLAALGPGDRVLDVGCGTGALSVLAADLVGETGRVLASDISEPLLGRASERLGRHPNAETLLGDAATVIWPDRTYNVAVSRFGVMFFSDPPRAFANIARALAPGGRIVFAAWGRTRDNPFWHLGTGIASAHLGDVRGTEENLPGPMGLADPRLAADRLKAAGLAEVEVVEEDTPLEYAGTLEDLADLMVMVGPARRVINAQSGSKDDVAAIREALVEALREIVTQSEGVSLPARINYLTARKPSA